MPRHLLRSTGIVLLSIVAVGRTASAHASMNWLDRVNFYRATAGLPPVTENPVSSGADWQHARYMVMHNVVQHTENPRESWATLAGASAAAVSNVAGSFNAADSDVWAIDTWMQAPFHAVGILDPALRQVGFGIYHAQKDKLQTAAALDIMHGRIAAPQTVTSPIVWPANGASVPLTTHMSEYPSPLTSCPGYGAPAGLPLIVQLGPLGAGRVPHVTRVSLVGDEGRLDACVFDEGTYRNHTAAEQQLGRNILAARGAIVLLPRRPLRAGSRYRAVIDVDGRVIDWTFQISGGLNE